MTLSELKSIDDVLEVLDSIIFRSVVENDASGYFAALYRQVTFEVKQRVEDEYFDDGERMERLDVLFAKRYIEAYFLWKDGQPITESWKEAFTFCKKRNPVVFQHILMGMNAHINLDLGIAAAKVSGESDIGLLKNDFFRINEILSFMVDDVQNNLSSIWPLLKKILSKTGKLDNLLVDFSMKLARNGAWRFAENLWETPANEWDECINERDSIIAQKSKIITSPGFWPKVLLWIIRLGEKGSVPEKINYLLAKNHNNQESVKIIKH